MKGVAITGMGIISAIGRNSEETHTGLKKAISGIGLPEILATNHKDLPVGEIKLSNAELSELLHLPEGHCYTRAALLGACAISDLLKNTGYGEFPEETGFISGTSVGGIDLTEEHFYDYIDDPGTRRFIPAQHPGFTTEKIAEYFKISGLVTTISTACSSSANAIALGARMIRSGRLKRVIVGGTDCLTKFTINGFNSLKILSQSECRPFDNHREGLNLGEAAAYILLEAEDCINDKPVLGRITGYGNANDAYHQTASSETGEGAYLAITKAIAKAGISSTEIDYINAHGTGTINNDQSESVALKRIFGEWLPEFSSTKAYTGHTLGAAGAVEAVFSLMALQNDEIYPNLNFETEMQETGLRPVEILQKKVLKTVLSNSFGFGGNCTALIFQRDGL